jgi:hypothetical protein
MLDVSSLATGAAVLFALFASRTVPAALKAALFCPDRPTVFRAAIQPLAEITARCRIGIEITDQCGGELVHDATGS